MIKGITIQLKVLTQTGQDEFNAPEFDEKWVDVDNVLIGEPSADDVTAEINLTGKHVAYTLAIPKGDDHDWTDTEVQFFGKKFRTIGAPVQGIEENIPLLWNKKVKVERYE
jgi:hypothetical protein